MDKERPNEQTWLSSRLEEPGALPGLGLTDKEATWDKLYERLSERPRRRNLTWLWAAAACILLALIPAAVLLKEKRAFPLSGGPTKIPVRSGNSGYPSPGSSDTSDFTISYCPTNIYSVGTPHEIIMATIQHKPVLFVSPPIVFPSLQQLRDHLKTDPRGTELLQKLAREIPIKENPRGIPSLWYIPLVGGENFFDGFGFARYRKKYGWRQELAIDEHERRFPPQRPLLPFVEKLNRELPKKWDGKLGKFVPDDDWLLWDFNTPKIRGKHVQSVRK